MLGAWCEETGGYREFPLGEIASVAGVP